MGAYTPGVYIFIDVPCLVASQGAETNHSRRPCPISSRGKRLQTPTQRLHHPKGKLWVLDQGVCAMSGGGAGSQSHSHAHRDTAFSFFLGSDAAATIPEEHRASTEHPWLSGLGGTCVEWSWWAPGEHTSSKRLLFLAT